MYLRKLAAIPLVVAIVAIGVTSWQSYAQEQEPVPVGIDPPGGVLFTAAGHSAVDAGGENWMFERFDFYPRGCSALYWAPDGSETSIQISMDGASDTPHESKLALNPDGTSSNLPGGVAVWNGQTTISTRTGARNVYTRFVLTVTDLTGVPLPLLPAPPPIGAAVGVAPSGGDFKANLQFEASFGSAGPWTAAAPFYNAQQTSPTCNNCLGSSFTAQFFCVPPVNLPPVVSCEESVNPSGKNIPGASGPNQDGFYVISSDDEEDDPDPGVYVQDADGSAVFGPFPSGSTVKITQAPGAPPSSKPMGGPNSAVAAHITLNTDAYIWSVDSFGDRSEMMMCRVPPR